MNSGLQYAFDFRADWKRHRVVIAVTAAATALFVIDLLLQLFVPSFQLKSVFWLMRSDLLERAAIFQPVTYSLFHADFFHLFFNMLIIWTMGRELEEKMGRRGFAVFLGLTVICGGMLHAAFTPLPVIGASAAVFGVLFCYAVYWPNRQVLVFFVFPVRIKYLVLILGAAEFLFSLQSLATIGAGRVSHWAHLGGLLAAAGWIAAGKKLELRHRLLRWQERRKLEKHRRRVENRIKEKERVDALLDKISAGGMESLSRKERRFLDTASKKYYDDDRYPGSGSTPGSSQ